MTDISANTQSSPAATGAAPITSQERVGELDVLRGFALIGVLIANLTGLGHDGLYATEAELAALPSAGINSHLDHWLNVIIANKANTLFAFLFGVGFWVQMERLDQSGRDFERIYLRRLMILLIIGLINQVFLFIWDILHLYAIAGFALFFMRKINPRALLILGLLLAFLSRPLWDMTGLSEWAFSIAYSDDSLAQRMAVSTGDDWWASVIVWKQWVWYDWVASGMILSWFGYALGRFLIGAWVAQKGWLQNARQYLPAFKKWLVILLPLGLAGQLLTEWIRIARDGGVLEDVSWAYTAQDFANFLSVPVMAAGYVCLIVVLFNSSWKWLVRPLAHVGRMALTNYIVQGILIHWVLSGIGFGLDLGGKIGTRDLLLIALGIFATQTVISSVWLKRFNYGPMEWLWRTLTYGQRAKWQRA